MSYVTRIGILYQVEAQLDYGPGSEIGVGWKIGVTWSRKRGFKMAATELGYLLTKSSFWLARNIWLNYEGRRPEFSQNGGYAAGFAKWLRAIACHITADFVMLACCRLNFQMHMPSTHIYPSFYKSCVMLHYSQFSK